MLAGRDARRDGLKQAENKETRRMNPHWPLVSLLFALAGCSAKDTCDTGDTSCDTAAGDTAPYDGATSISKVDWTCDDTSYTYQIYTTGWTGGGLLNVVQNGDTTSTTPWSEAHPLSSVEFDVNGYWDHLSLTLTILQQPACDRDNFDADNACWKMQEADVNTLWLCDPATESELTWAATVYNYADPTTTADCVTWGYDTSYYPGCTAFEANQDL